MILQRGMKVLIKDDKINFKVNVGKIKTITRNLPNFNGRRAFELDNYKDAIWLIEDFEKCIDYPDLPME